MDQSMGFGKRINQIWLALGLGAAALFYSVAAWAAPGQPVPKQLGLQDPVTPVAKEIEVFHDWVTMVIIAIALFVLILLAIVIFRFNERANPTPSTVTHNTALEVVWTVVPIIILVVIAIPSFKLLYLQYSYPKPDLTIKAVGNTWNWEHQYPDHGNFSITSAVVRDSDLLLKKLGQKAYDEKYAKLSGITLQRRLYADAKPLWQAYGKPRLLAVDNEIAVPVGKVVHVLVTSNDVIHNWTIPSFGSKVDAVPGRVTATWFKANKEGIYYGQCSELCGRDHAFMPIAVRVVSDSVFKQWVAARKARNGAKANEILEKAAAEQNKRKKVAAVGTGR